MKIKLITENKKEKDELKAKEILLTDISEYTLVAKRMKGSLILGEDYYRSGNVLYLVGRLYSAITELKSIMFNGSSK